MGDGRSLNRDMTESSFTALEVIVSPSLYPLKNCPRNHVRHSFYIRIDIVCTQALFNIDCRDAYSPFRHMHTTGHVPNPFRE